MINKRDEETGFTNLRNGFMKQEFYIKYRLLSISGTNFLLSIFRYFVTLVTNLFLSLGLSYERSFRTNQVVLVNFVGCMFEHYTKAPQGVV